MQTKDNNIRAFEHHGFHFNKMVGNQAEGDCPLCGRAGRFYINTDNKLWDCKKCGAKGNASQFLEQIAIVNEKRLTDQILSKLAVDRKLPLSAFRGIGLGWDGLRYTIPVKDIAGKVVDVRTYRIGEKARATTGAKLGLLWADTILSRKGAPIYICEGEWDGVALRWLIRKLEKDIVVVAVPGASVFKQDWMMWLEGRDIVSVYDHDGAGDAGNKLIREKLTGIAKSVQQIHWPEDLPDGFDVRDLVVREAIKGGKPRGAWKLLQAMVSPHQMAANGAEPALDNASKGSNGAEAPSVRPKPKWPLDSVKIYQGYQKWMHLPNDEVLRVMFGAVFANKLQGDPIWLFMVAPPGGSKSELLQSLSTSPLVESTTALTPHSLVSGAAFLHGQDPSLLPKLDGRILVIKDFTTILSMHYTSRDEIFGVLRDAYDGNTTKTFGTGVKRSYVSHFGIIAGVTPKIEEFGVVHQSLGERFLKYRISTGQKTLSEADRIRRSMRNINHEKEMKAGLAEIGADVLLHPVPVKEPTIPDVIFEYIVNLAQTCAMMRGVVERNQYSGMVQYKPAIEVGTRLAKQFTKLGMGIAMYLKRPTVDLEIYRILRKVALDTAPDRVEEIIKQVWKSTPAEESTLNTAEISAKTHLPVPTCFRVCQDLELLGVLKRLGSGNKYLWRISEKMLKLIQGGRIYERSADTVLQMGSDRTPDKGAGKNPVTMVRGS